MPYGAPAWLFNAADPLIAKTRQLHSLSDSPSNIDRLHLSILWYRLLHCASKRPSIPSVVFSSESFDSQCRGSGQSFVRSTGHWWCPNLQAPSSHRLLHRCWYYLTSMSSILGIKDMLTDLSLLLSYSIFFHWSTLATLLTRGVRMEWRLQRTCTALFGGGAAGGICTYT